MVADCLSNGTSLQNGKYRILRLLGQGGFGITYEAEQPLLRRKVAIKEFFMKDFCNRDLTASHVTLGTSEGSKEQVERFRKKFIREAQIIAGFNNPHIIKVYDVFEENGTAYYVMDYISGGSLATKVQKEGPLKKEQVLLYIHQVGDALGYLHCRNFLHFDVKPSNILLNDKDEAVLIDFGISKHYDEVGLQTTSTPIGVSPGYAPLEQYQQTNISIFTPSTDIYSLGATLYYLLTGQTPPDAAHVYEEGLPLMPSTIDVYLQQAIRDAMSPRRQDRPQDVASFLAIIGGKQSDSEETISANIPLPKPSLTAPLPSFQSTPIFSSTGGNKPNTTRTKNKEKWLWLIIAGLVLTSFLAFLVSKGAGGFNKLELSVSGQTGGHDWVDLGLSVKWATCNVGASSINEPGYHLAWGETSPKSEYNWKTYRFRAQGYSDDDIVFSKYNRNSNRGLVDSKEVLELNDDAARVNWGGGWRTPTIAEMDELHNKCKWTWTKVRGKNGYIITSTINGNRIFLPVTGMRWDNKLGGTRDSGYYWSSSLSPSSGGLGPFMTESRFADKMHFYKKNIFDHGWAKRYDGFCIRPVID